MTFSTLSLHQCHSVFLWISHLWLRWCTDTSVHLWLLKCNRQCCYPELGKNWLRLWPNKIFPPRYHVHYFQSQLRCTHMQQDALHRAQQCNNSKWETGLPCKVGRTSLFMERHMQSHLCLSGSTADEVINILLITYNCIYLQLISIFCVTCGGRGSSN